MGRVQSIIKNWIASIFVVVSSLLPVPFAITSQPNVALLSRHACRFSSSFQFEEGCPRSFTPLLSALLWGAVDTIAR